MAVATLELNGANSRKRHTSPPISRMKEETVLTVPTENSSKKSKRNSQKLNPEQHANSNYVPHPCGIGFGELERVSEALGLRKDFLDGVKSIPYDKLCHRGLQGFVAIFIESEHFHMEEESLKEKLSEELLRQVGFTDSEVINTIMIRSKKMKQHLDPLDFIKRFVEDEFKYNPTLIEYAPEDEAKITGDAFPFPVFHFPDHSNNEQNQNCEVVLLYHGTDLYSAKDIMKNGIEIDFGRHKHDFSDGGGFYLTSFEHAKTWARSQTRKPVVLELKIPKACLEKARTWDLSKEEGRSEWDRVVSEHRSGRPSKKLRQEMKEYDCITGPIAVPSQDPDSDKKCFKPERGSYQRCVVKQSFAEEIEKNAKYTLYTEPEA